MVDRVQPGTRLALAVQGFRTKLQLRPKHDQPSTEETIQLAQQMVSNCSTQHIQQLLCNWRFNPHNGAIETNSASLTNLRLALVPQQVNGGVCLALQCRK